MEERFQEKSALAWVRKQAKAIDSSIADDESVGQCTRIISGAIKIDEPDERAAKEVIKLNLYKIAKEVDNL